MRTMQRVLVTDGAGYLGSCVAASTTSQAFRYIFDKLAYDGEALLPFNRDERFKLVRGDVRAHAAVSAALAGIDVIVHFAGWSAASLFNRSRAISVDQCRG